MDSGDHPTSKQRKYNGVGRTSTYVQALGLVHKTGEATWQKSGAATGCELDHRARVNLLCTVFNDAQTTSMSTFKEAVFFLDTVYDLVNNRDNLEWCWEGENSYRITLARFLMGEETRLSASYDARMRNKFERLDQKFTIGGVAAWGSENLYSMVGSMKNIRDVCWSISETDFKIAHLAFQRAAVKLNRMIMRGKEARSALMRRKFRSKKKKTTERGDE